MPDALVDADRFKDVLGAVAAPVAVVTSLDDAGPHGTTVSAFCSLSLAPPMVLVSLDGDSTLLARVRRSGRFAINVLAQRQAALATRFARKGADKFADVAWHDESGLPRLPDARGFIACRVERHVPAGDHVLVLGLVEQAERSDASPLLYCERRFGSFGEAA